MLIVLGDATAAPGRRDELVAAAREVASATRADEGCVSYGFFADVEDGDRILSVEIWADRAALEAHMTHDHTRSSCGSPRAWWPASRPCPSTRCPDVG